MEENVQFQAPNGKKKLLFTLFFALLLLILIPGVFYYLTKQGSLTQEKAKETKISPQPTYKDVVLKSVPIANCPTGNCRSAVVIDENQLQASPKGASRYFYGLGLGNLTLNSAVSAGIDGRVTTEDKVENGQNVTYVYITNSDRNVIFGYKFIKNSLKLTKSNGIVNLDEKIGTLATTDKIKNGSGNFSLIVFIKIISSNYYAVISPDNSGKTINTENE